MTVKEIASRLAEHCRQGEFETAQRELYAEDIVSIEPFATPEFEKETKGLEAVLEKVKKFESMVETVNEYEVSEPLIAGQSIAFTLRMNVVMKGKGQMDNTELCVYKVKDGKVISEEFFV